MPRARANETRNWFDCTINAAGNACATGVSAPTDSDDIAQAHEIGPGGATFGIREDRDFDPDIQRERNTEITFGVQHQLFSRVSLIAQYYRRTFQDMEMLDRELITTTDYTSFQAPLPADISRDPEVAAIVSPGQLVTIYNLRPAKLPVYTSQQRDKTTPDLSSTYNGFDFAMTARTPGGGTIFGSWTVERNISNFCANDDNPNGVLTADRYTGANVAAGGAFCDQGDFGMPLRHEFKTAGSVPVRWGIDLGAVLQSYAGSERVITWVPAAGVFPGRAHAIRNGRGERAGLALLSALQPGGLQRQEDVPGGPQDLLGTDRLVQPAERQRDILAEQPGGHVTRTDSDDSAGPPDAAGLPDEVVGEWAGSWEQDPAYVRQLADRQFGLRNQLPQFVPLDHFLFQQPSRDRLEQLTPLRQHPARACRAPLPAGA